MLNSKYFIVLAGNPQPWDEETLRRCRSGAVTDTINSEDLCAVQVDQWARGRRSAVLNSTMYGWSVGIDSNLGDRKILLSGRREGRHIEKEEAIAFGIAWANEDPANREFYVQIKDAPSNPETKV